MQPGDIVESVDMEMSDDETDSKPKGRVLVDLRSQDRDMRVGLSSSHLDMDMRMIPLPTGQMPGSRGQLVQDVHLMHAGPPPPPPPPPQFHQGQSGFRQEQTEFHRNQSVDFHGNQQNFHQNRPPPNFMQSSQDFHSNQQDFHSLHQSQQDFHQSQQDFEYRDRQHDIRSKQDFLTESPGRGRYPQSDHQHRDSSSFHRNERNNRGGRGFSRNRRERYSDDHSMKQRNLMNNRKLRSQEQPSPEILPNSRPLLLQPPDTVVILDDEGMPIGMPEFNQDNTAPSNMAVESRESQERDDNCQSSMLRTRRTSHDTPSSHDSERNQQHQGYQLSANLAPDHERAPSSAGSDDQQLPMNQVTVIPLTMDASDVQQNQYVPISEYEEHVESDHSGTAEKSVLDGNESVHEGQDTGFVENEQPEEQLAGSTTSGELKRPANGSFDEQPHDDGNVSKKKTLLPNGPQISGDSGSNSGLSPHGTPTELHPGVIYEYDGHGSPSPNFRPRIGGPVPFPPWRGGPPRGGRGGFRGGPRGPWLDRGPRGLAAVSFSSRGLKRGGGQFRGSGFRGRGRGSNW